MERITNKQLKYMVERINQLTGSPPMSWTKRANSTNKANIGNYHLDWAYGKVGLVRMMNEGGGVESIIGLDTKRGLYERMQAFVRGLEIGKENTRELLTLLQQFVGKVALWPEGDNPEFLPMMKQARRVIERTNGKEQHA